jgi:hypothetical protein
MADPRMLVAAGNFQKRSPEAAVQITSTTVKFMYASVLTNIPLYVSPDFNSTSTGDPFAARNSERGNCDEKVYRLCVREEARFRSDVTLCSVLLQFVP